VKAEAHIEVHRDADRFGVVQAKEAGTGDGL
jgi:hypothetical protein